MLRFRLLASIALILVSTCAARAARAASAAPSGVDSVTATKADTLVTDNDHDGKVDPGDTIEYRVRITNHAHTNALDVSFSDTIDPSTALDGSPNVSPLAFDDAYATVGNTRLEVGIPPGAAPAVRVAGSVLANDVEFLGDTFVLSAWDAVSANGGTVAMNLDGTFAYLPAAGFTGTDQFTYTIMDPAGLTGTGTVSIAVVQRVWYVDNAALPGGDGRSTAPFNGLAPVNGAGGAGDADGPGDIVFVYHGVGPYVGGLELENAESLIGEGVALIVDPGTGPVMLVPAGARPTITRAGGTSVALASGNTVRGLDVTATGGAGIAGAAAGTLTVNEVSVATTDGLALQIAGGALDVTLSSVAATNALGGGVLLQNNTGSTTIDSLSITNTGATGFAATNSGTVAVTGPGNQIHTTAGAALSLSGTTIGASGFTLESLSSTGAANGIVLANTGALAGLTITGDGSANSGGSIVNALGDAIALTSVRSLSLTDFQITGSAGNHLDAATMSNGVALTRVFADQSGSDGMRLVNVLGTSSIASSTITRSAGINLWIQNSTATTPAPGAPDLFTIAGGTFTNTLFSVSGSSGIRFEGLSGGNLRLVLGTSTVSDNRIDGLEVKAGNASRVDVRVSGTAFTGNLGSAINVAGANTATAIADVRNLSGLRSALNVINLIGFDTSTIDATIDHVQILESTTGSGIRAIQEGNGTVTAQLSNNDIRGIAQAYGIMAQARAGTGSMSLSVTGNTVDNTASGVLALEGMNFESGSSAGGDANSICLNLSGNSSAVSAISAQEGYRLRQRVGTTFNLQNFLGNGALAADVTNWVNVTKGNTGTTQILIGTSFSNAPGSCPMPPPLPVLVSDEPTVADLSPSVTSAASAPARSSAPFVTPERQAAGIFAVPASFTPATDVPVAIGTLPPGKSVTIVFRVAIDSVIAGGAKIVTNQGAVSGSNFATVLTDDPDAPGAQDPTVTIIDDTLLPHANLDDPNGHHVYNVGDSLKIAWSATDNQGVTTVDLRLSRNNGATWEDLALGLANTGTYMWSVTPPGTNTNDIPVYSALIEVRARDANGNVGSDQSDSAFAIFDGASEALLSLFQATPAAGGIEVRWKIQANLAASAVLERAPETSGPWTRVAGTSRVESEATVLVDSDVEPGRSYFYRITARTPAGQPVTFGPLRATADAIMSFALSSVAPNPSRGSTRIELSVAFEAPVRLSVVDLQGREVAVLLDRSLSAGRYQAVWNGESSHGPAAAGIYFVRYHSPQGTLVRRVVLTR